MEGPGPGDKVTLRGRTKEMTIDKRVGDWCYCTYVDDNGETIRTQFHVDSLVEAANG